MEVDDVKRPEISSEVYSTERDEESAREQGTIKSRRWSQKRRSVEVGGVEEKAVVKAAVGRWRVLQSQGPDQMRGLFEIECALEVEVEVGVVA